jgi:SnoaL-like domain
MMGDHLVLKRVYEAFNARDIDTVLTAMHPDVDWPNGWEGGRVYGHSGVRDYWTRQWAVLDPRVDPVGFHEEESGRIAVDVHAIIRDREGKLLADHMVQHVYLIEDDLIRSMEIREIEEKGH